MIKLQNQFKIISIYLFVLLGFFLIFNTKCLHAFPGIDLDARKHQLEEEINTLMIELTNVFNDTNLESQTRFNRISLISNRINIVGNNLQMINQQIFARNQYNLQIQINQNQT
ncbi:SVM family protein, predicted signal peptide [Candidatus Phytoplasma rubi]|uniref:SVM family protein, predicted signal peptide n=1 Tax=Candidatus Phytoplasma rubi TaxID=399025 RepID=A0ABY7BSN4_9MOLU|nr:SVM family protein [Candidatus Phytoplasma rubi]WAN63393.1 SVM family protein, predicted signal peptide [Candidatus Phytoplasma rubi]